MAFRLRYNEFFRGKIIEPCGERREKVVVSNGTRTQTVSATMIAAGQQGWEWEITLLREDRRGVSVIARWAELAGGSLPPFSRAEVPGLDKKIALSA